MFQWYKRSVECWVHLADASLSDDGVDTTAPLEKSRWFNRGWTLQELIAPNHVHFFSYEWTLIGILDDDAFRDRVSKLTGISTSYLGVNNDNYPVNHASVSHRMTWAANRETTVPEDLAYCLLGLFDVNMPLLYGEGRERAFIKLQEEILKQSEDQTLLAWGYGMSLQAENQKGNLLATSPRFFAHGAKLYPSFLVSDGLPAIHSQMTNRGLLVELRFYPTFYQDSNPQDRLSRRYIALLNCQHTADSILESSRQVAMYVEVGKIHLQQTEHDASSDSPFPHDALVRRIRSSRPFILSKNTLDILGRPCTRRVYLTTLIAQPSLNYLTFPLSRHWQSIRVQFILESDCTMNRGQHMYTWELMECVPPPDVVEHVTTETERGPFPPRQQGKEENRCQRHIDAKLWLLARDGWGDAPRNNNISNNQETVSIIHVHGRRRRRRQEAAEAAETEETEKGEDEEKSFTLVMRVRTQGNWSATSAAIALLEPPRGVNDPNGIYSAVDQFGALVSGQIQPVLYDITKCDGVVTPPVKISLPGTGGSGSGRGRLRALFT